MMKFNIKMVFGKELDLEITAKDKSEACHLAKQEAAFQGYDLDELLEIHLES